MERSPASATREFLFQTISLLSGSFSVQARPGLNAILERVDSIQACLKEQFGR
jgi:hypothetical protein